MKKAFTMIELIFVIVIIGILASVALPKLAATRDDAILSKIEANIKQLVTDIYNYRTAQGSSKYLTASLPDITDISLDAHANCSGPVHTGQFVNKTLNYCADGYSVFRVTSDDVGSFTLRAQDEDTHLGKLLQRDKVFQKYTNGIVGKQYDLTIPQVRRD